MSIFLRQSVALVCLFSLSSAYAQVVPTTPGDTDLIRNRQDRLLEEQQKRLQELQELPGPAVQPETPPTSDDGRCFTLRTIVLQGADHLSAAERARLTQPYEGQCVGVNQLNALLKAVTDHYIGRGYVTSRAYLPQQDLSQGTLTILVVEGKLESIKPAEGSGLTPRELNRAFPGDPGKLLNLRELEQLVDQLNRLPSNQVQMDLVPGQQVGGSEVQIKNAPGKPWRASLSRNNNGQASTGEQQWGLGFEWDNPLGLADQLILRGGHDGVSDSDQLSKNGYLAYSLPWGWWTFDYSYSQSRYRSQAESNGFAFEQSGKSENQQFKAERVVHRDAVSKTALNGGLSLLHTDNYIEDSRLAVSSNRITELQVGFNHGRRFGSAFVNLDLGWQRGIGAFAAQGDLTTGPGQPTARYSKYTATLSYLQSFQLLGENLSFSSLATGQYSEDVLFSPQRLSLGGLSSVRGFKDQSLSGDTGGYWRNDLRWSRAVTWAWLQPVFSQYGAGLGYDQGVIQGGRYNPEVRGRLSSNSLELFARGRYLAASVTFAHSLERPDALPEREHPVYFSVDLFL
ncbi:MAG: ShlB/FhaC/HecB family hemolysin secretion/activation protein [Pseudomonas oryzihabitans]